MNVVLLLCYLCYTTSCVKLGMVREQKAKYSCTVESECCIVVMLSLLHNLLRKLGMVREQKAKYSCTVESECCIVVMLSLLHNLLR